MPIHAKFHRKRSKGCRDMAIYSFFKYGSSLPFWIHWTFIGSIYQHYSLVFNAVQNLDKISAMVSLI